MPTSLLWAALWGHAHPLTQWCGPTKGQAGGETDAHEDPGNVMLSLGGLKLHRQGGDKNIPGRELDEEKCQVHQRPLQTHLIGTQHI